MASQWLPRKNNVNKGDEEGDVLALEFEEDEEEGDPSHFIDEEEEFVDEDIIPLNPSGSSSIRRQPTENTSSPFCYSRRFLAALLSTTLTFTILMGVSLISPKSNENVNGGNNNYRVLEIEKKAFKKGTNHFSYGPFTFDEEMIITKFVSAVLYCARSASALLLHCAHLVMYGYSDQ